MLVSTIFATLIGLPTLHTLLGISIGINVTMIGAVFTMMRRWVTRQEMVEYLEDQWGIANERFGRRIDALEKART